MKSLLRGAFAAVTVLIALAATQPAQAINLVLNPGFETGDLTSWTSGGWGVDAFKGNHGPYDGTYFAETGCVTSYCSLSQNLATVSGQTYTLTFAFNPGPGADGGNGDTQVYWNGALKLDLAGGSEAWTVYTISNLLATSNSTALLFSGYQKPSYNGLDDVSVQAAATTTPIPAALPLFATGLGAIGLLARRRKRKTSADTAAA